MIRLVRLTPPGRAAVAGVALVGIGAAELVGRYFPGKPFSGDGAVRVGTLVDGTGPIDQVLAIRRSGGRMEIFCHGGAASAGRIASLFREAGAVEENGEALPEGDTVRREALGLLPEALTERAARMLLSQEEGALARWARGVAARLAAGDARSAAELARMRGTFRAGRALTVPARLAIAGPPNAGKSTLLNRFYGEARAVVSVEAGTTRDPVEVLIGIGGVPLRVADTAGLGIPRDALDEAGQERARQRIAAADVVLAVFDGSILVCPSSRVRDEWAWLDAARTLWVLNKSDLQPPSPSTGEGRGEGDWISVSALTGEGIDALGREIVQKIAGDIPASGEPCLFTERQEKIIRGAGERAAAGDLPVAASIIGTI